MASGPARSRRHQCSMRAVQPHAGTCRNTCVGNGLAWRRPTLDSQGRGQMAGLPLTIVSRELEPNTLRDRPLGRVPAARRLDRLRPTAGADASMIVRTGNAPNRPAVPRAELAGPSAGPRPGGRSCWTLGQPRPGGTPSYRWDLARRDASSARGRIHMAPELLPRGTDRDQRPVLGPRLADSMWSISVRSGARKARPVNGAGSIRGRRFASRMTGRCGSREMRPCCAHRALQRHGG